VASKLTHLQRGRRRGREQLARALHELREARDLAGVSQRTLAGELRLAQSTVWRMENALDDVGVVRLAEIASVLGLQLAVSLYPVGDAVRDQGQLALGSRFDALLSSRWRGTDETLLPGAGEQRAWDKLLRLVGSSPPYLVGVDLETRIRDIQALVRRTRGRERDGRVDAILIVVSNSAVNRRLAGELRRALGDGYLNQSREIARALRAGQRLPGGGVLLL
jgi:transcriptional regulator with XRE-family HTH domain